MRYRLQQISLGYRGEEMETKKALVLFCIALLAVIALAGNAQALVEPVGGQVDKTDAEEQIVTLWVNDRWWDNMTVAITDVPGYDDAYAFEDLTPLLTSAGGSTSGTYNVTIAMYCGGSNTYHNETGTHLYNIAYDGNPKYPPLLNLESCAAEETFSKTLHAGWNLISLPLDPEDDCAASAVLSTVSYDAVYRYNSTSKQFESADVMDTGTGYFVHATADCTWEYSGTSYTSIGTELKQGLNMVGWLDCPKDIGEALSSISGDCYYAARWNAAAQKFEVYNPAAPSAFNDFTTMDQGTGYFISARQDCTLSESC